MEAMSVIHRLSAEYGDLLSYFAIPRIPLRFVSEPEDRFAGNFVYNRDTGIPQHIRMNLAQVRSEEMGLFVLAHETRHYSQFLDGRLSHASRRYHNGLPDELFHFPDERYRLLYSEVDANAFAGWWIGGRLTGEPDPTFAIKSDNELRMRSLGSQKRYLAMVRKRHATYAVYPREMEGETGIGKSMD